MAEGAADESVDNENLRPPLRKRRKMSSPSQPTSYRTTTVRRRQCRIRRSRCGVPNPPSLKGSGKARELAKGFVASFKERKISNAVLKTVIVGDVATFQLEWAKNLSCAEHKPKDGALKSQQCKPLPKGP